MDKAMTLKAMLQAVVEGNITEDVQARALAEIEKIDRANAKKREKAAEKSEANLEVVKQIVEHLGDEPKTAAEVMNELVAEDFEREDGKAMNVQFVTPKLKKAVELGLAVQTEVKRTGKGTQKGYIAL